MSKREFQTEVSQLLQLIVHSLYSHPEIFLRELISNSSDALDKLRHLTLVDDAYKSLPFDPRIDLELDEEKQTLTIADTGIGMNEEDLISHLGTIARSGTKNFLSQLSGDARKDSNLIGQFGVGFYSAFMVADKIEVVSRKAGEELAWRWTSDGQSGFEIEPAERLTAGTTILLHFNEEGKQYANSWRLQEIVKKYSNHIAFPIFLTYDKSEWNAEEKKSIKTRTTEQVNAASALWRRPKSEITDEAYKELYQSITGDSQDPLFWFHTKAEGSLEYTTLFYIPSKAPLDLYQADYRVGVKLYVRRVFIMDEDAPDVELDAYAIVGLVEVERSLGWDVEEGCVFEAAFGFGVEPEERVLRVAGDGLIELLVGLVGDLALGAAPEGAGGVDLLGGAGLDGLLLFGVPLAFVVGEEDGERDVVGVLLDNLTQAPAIGVLLAFFIEVKGDCGARGEALGGLDVEACLAVAGPAP